MGRHEVGKDADMPSPPSMRTHTRETLALLWQGRWDVARAAALVPALFMAGIVSVVLVGVVSDEELIHMLIGGPVILAAWLLMALYPPAVLLHTLGHRARGEAVSFRQSCRAVLKQLRQLIGIAVMIPAFHYATLLVISILAPMMFMLIVLIALGPERSKPSFELLNGISGASAFAASFVVVAFSLRKALIAPALVVVGGLDAKQAWLRSGTVMTWRRVFAALPFCLPLIAIQPLGIWFIRPEVFITLLEVLGLEAFFAAILLLPPLSLMIASAGSVIPWRDTLNEPDGPKPKPAPRPRPAPTHNIPTSDLIP